ncbi:MbtH family protein [Bacillus massiliglaciei]|uniref:MbtH family protein n=1 Tax=Bacillus massiliglaciei TaxID=1816693 RepID=UPI000A57C141|nr:MbtH family protein [Bacillus massiliglaciei]
MTNPFENEDSLFLVLMNEEGQYSLWPAFLDVPAGWVKKFGQSSRVLCQQYIESNWRDMRPASIKEELAASNK